METLTYLIQLFLELDKVLGDVISRYGVLTYVILLLIIFCETGLVVTPILPGDSLLFAAGAFAALGALDINILLGLLILAAVAGDTVNYWVGHWIGPRAFSGDIRFLKQRYLDRTREFYHKHGGKTIILARFVPIVRTFAPFVAGIGAMNYTRFIVFNVVGGVLWVASLTLAGYFFGNIPIVKQHFELVIIAIVIISVLPIVYETLREYSSASK
ncbi:MAG: DedA family protein [Thermodesulfobacteriota bacterium]